MYRPWLDGPEISNDWDRPTDLEFSKSVLAVRSPYNHSNLGAKMCLRDTGPELELKVCRLRGIYMEAASTLAGRRRNEREEMEMPVRILMTIRQLKDATITADIWYRPCGL